MFYIVRVGTDYTIYPAERVCVSSEDGATWAAFLQNADGEFVGISNVIRIYASQTLVQAVTGLKALTTGSSGLGALTTIYIAP